MTIDLEDIMNQSTISKLRDEFNDKHLKCGCPPDSPMCDSALESCMDLWTLIETSAAYGYSEGYKDGKKKKSKKR